MLQPIAKNLSDQQMLRLLLKKAMISGCYVLTAFIFEIVVFLWIGIGFLPEYWVLDIGILLFIGTLLLIVPGFKAQTICAWVLLFVQMIFSLANNTLFGMSNMVFSFSMLNIIGEAGNVFSSKMVDFWLLGVYVLLFSCSIYGFIRINKKVHADGSLVLHTVLLLVFVFFLSILISWNLFGITKKQFKRADPANILYYYSDDLYLWETQFMTATAYKKFGTFGFYTKNILNFLEGGKEDYDEQERKSNLASIDAYFREGEWSGTLTPETQYGGMLSGEFKGKNVVLVVIESGEWYDINKKYTPTLYSMASNGISMVNYYARDKTNHSEAMSILGSYPSALDTSIIPSANNPEGLLDHDFAFTSANILSKNGYTTNYFHANEGSFYKRNLTHQALYGFENVHFMDTMERLEGYYDKGINFYNFDKDSEMISQYLNEYEYTEPEKSAFFTMMLSLISHGHYDDLTAHGDYTADLSVEKKQELSQKYTVKGLEPYYEIIDSYPDATIKDMYIDPSFAITQDKYDEEGNVTNLYLEYKRHQAGVMDLDVGLNRLIYDLQQKGELENTLFIVYADHCSYFNNMQYPLKGVDSEKYYWDTKLYNIPFFIWSGDMGLEVNNPYGNRVYENNDEDVTSVYEGSFYNDFLIPKTSSYGGVQVDKACNSFDILPTMLDLLGFEYNTNLYQGTSVFREGTSVFISRESGLLTGGLYSDAEYLYFAATQQGNAYVSYDGQLVYMPDRLTALQNGKKVVYLLDQATEGIQVHESGKYIIIDIVQGASFIPDSAINFITKVNQYYYKQENLENMYRYDYFADRDIGLFVRVAK